MVPTAVSSMKKLVLVSLVAVLSVVPAFALAQPDKGGGEFGCDTKGKQSQSDNGQTRRDSSETHSSIDTGNASSGTTPPAGAPGTYSAPPASRPITKADCEQAHGTWEEMQMKCILC